MNALNCPFCNAPVYREAEEGMQPGLEIIKHEKDCYLGRQEPKGESWLVGENIIRCNKRATDECKKTN